MTGRGGGGGVPEYELAVLAQDEAEARRLMGALACCNTPSDPLERARSRLRYEQSILDWGRANRALERALRTSAPRDGAGE